MKPNRPTSKTSKSRSCSTRGDGPVRCTAFRRNWQLARCVFQLASRSCRALVTGIPAEAGTTSARLRVQEGALRGSRETSDLWRASGPNSHEFGYKLFPAFAILLLTRSYAPRLPAAAFQLERSGCFPYTLPCPIPATENERKAFATIPLRYTAAGWQCPLRSGFSRSISRRWPDNGTCPRHHSCRLWRPKADSVDAPLVSPAIPARRPSCPDTT